MPDTFRPLGPHLNVFPVGFGGAAVSGDAGGYGFGPMEEAAALELLKTAFECGITLFDTAPIYGFGQSEKIIGRALAQLSAEARRRVQVVSKLGVTWDEQKKVSIDNSPETTKRMLHSSLKNLQTDCLDLYMIHWPDPKTPLRATMEFLLKAKEDKLIKSIGACNFDRKLMEEALSIGPVDVAQNDFSYLHTHAKDTGYLDFLKEKGIGFMSYGTLAKGMLSGKLTKNTTFDHSDTRASRKGFMEEFERNQEKIEALKNEGQALGLSLSQMAVRWVLEQNGVSVALCGAKTPEQVRDLCSGQRKK